MQSLETIRALHQEQQQQTDSEASAGQEQPKTRVPSSNQSEDHEQKSDPSEKKKTSNPLLSKSVIYHRNPEFHGPITDSAAWVEELQDQLEESDEEDPNLTQELSHGLALLSKVRPLLLEIDSQVTANNTILVDTHWDLLSLYEEIVSYLNEIKRKWL